MRDQTPERRPPRRPGLSLRAKLTLSYAAIVVAAGVMLGFVAFVLLHYVPTDTTYTEVGDISPSRGELLTAILPWAALSLGVLAVIGIVGGWFLAGVVLRPLAPITRAAQLAASGSLAHRIELPGPSDELRDLADVFDTMLARIERHVGEQERFAANAAHELRTPLAVTQAMLEVARADPDADVDALLRRLEHVNRQAVEITESLLVLARIERRQLTASGVDLATVVDGSVEPLLALADRRGIRVEVDTDAAPVTGDAVLLGRLSANLVHNALVHNRDPAAGRRGSVWVTTRPGLLVVENTGDLLDPAVVATLTEPFERGHTRARGPDDHRGAGLGLAIAESIVRLHGGRLILTARDGGGLVAVASFPVAEPDPCPTPGLASVR